MAVTVCPATVTEPLKVLCKGFGLAVTVTDPDPVAVAGLTVIHELFEIAVHVHSDATAVTFTVAVPPVPAKFIVPGLTVYVQPAVPNCCTEIE